MSANGGPALAESELAALAREHGTPLYVYDLDTVLVRLAELQAFDVVRYAQKANSNLALLTALERAGAQVDAVSAGEIERALTAGFAPKKIVYTADLFDKDALELVREHDLHVNVGSTDMIDQLAVVRPGAAVTLRINPGFGGGHDRKVHCGGPTSKHGIWHADLPDALRRARAAGLAVRGLHIHVGSGTEAATYELLPDTLGTLVESAREHIAVVSIGGGLPTPYRAEEPRFDLDAFTSMWLAARANWEQSLRRELTLEIEPGRYLVAEAGVLVTEVRATKSTGEFEWVIVDAGFHTLARPMLYGAYHRITALEHGNAPAAPRVVAGPLCEAADVLTQDKAGRPDPQVLPAVQPGDLLCIHDTGAYGASMASNYNSRQLPAEILVANGEAIVVRTRQRMGDLLAAELPGLAALRARLGSS
jgi:diaminopimelate decarboxylase